MKRNLLVLFGLMFAIFACTNECLNEFLNESLTESNLENNSGNNQTDIDEPVKKFTTLQQVVNDTNAGEEIDLSEYKDLTDYSATVNKTLTIKNGSLNNAKLQITAENVKLEKIEKVSVSTSSKLTITNSKLSDLLIGGSGETSRSTTSDLETSLAMVSVTGCEIADIQLKGFNSQLNITDTATKIDDIVTSTKSKIILEAGSYDGMKDPVVEDNGELTRIDMTKDKELSVLSIYSNPKKAEYKLNEEIDLTGLIVMGTYTASVEIFKSGGWKGEAIESVTKWEDEKDYSVSYNFGTAGVQIVTIKSKSADVECNFYVYVVDDSQNNGTSQPEKEEIKFENIRVVTLGTVKTLYKVGEKLDLSCYQVVGTYNDFDINLSYTSEPANGMVLTAENKEIKFYYNDEIVGTKEITVKQSYKVEFYDGIGDGKLLYTLEVADGESLKLPVAPNKTGYTFDVWVDDVKNKVTSEKNVEEDLKLYATWTADTYTITYNLYEGENNTNNPTSYTVETRTITLSSPTKTGYTFGGWYDNANLTGEKITQIANGSAGDITLHAKWTADTYTITYNLYEGKNNADNPTSYNVETSTITLFSPTKTGYTFDGWYTDEAFTNAKTQITKGSTENITLYAQWTANTYTVKFNANGGSSAMDSQTFAYDTEQALTANAFTRTGYIFAGWNTQPDGKGTSYADKKNVKNLTVTKNGEVTLYAQWTANTYTVKFNANVSDNSVTGTMTDQTFTYDKEEPLRANAFTRTGYTFAGWNTQPDGKGRSYTDMAKVKNLTAENNTTVTLYAVWEAKYSGGIEIEGNKDVTFLLNEKASNATITLSESVTISVKSGDTSLTDTTLTITVYNHGDVASPTQSLTQNTDGTYSFTIPETFPKDETYQFVVSCNYESITYTDTFTVKLSQ